MSRYHAQRALTLSVTAVLLGLGTLAVIMHLHGTKFLSVQSGSMVPTFSKGSLVIVAAIPYQQYKVGDIITYTNPSNTKEAISHRIVEVKTSNGKPTGEVVTKGDANGQRDKAIPVEAIVGKVDYHIPDIGYFYNFIMQPLGLLLVIYIPALSVIIGEVKRLITYYKRMEAYIARGFGVTLSKRP
jgi:signal peptidase